MVGNDPEAAPAAPKMVPTEPVGNAGEHALPAAALLARRERDPTADDVLGPYYRRGAPYRAKVSPPQSDGEVLQISGRIWGMGVRHPLGGALLDVWQANAAGHYDDDDPAHPPGPHQFDFRTRYVCGDDGAYAFETVYPGPYKMDATTWRSPHIHFVVRALGFKTLVTQLFFEGAQYLDTDPFMKRSLVIPLTDAKGPAGGFRRGHFDIVLGIDVDPANPG